MCYSRLYSRCSIQGVLLKILFKTVFKDSIKGCIHGSIQNALFNSLFNTVFKALFKTIQGSIQGALFKALLMTLFKALIQYCIQCAMQGCIQVSIQGSIQGALFEAFFTTVFKAQFKPTLLKTLSKDLFRVFYSRLYPRLYSRLFSRWSVQGSIQDCTEDSIQGALFKALLNTVFKALFRTMLKALFMVLYSAYLCVMHVIPQRLGATEPLVYIYEDHVLAASSTLNKAPSQQTSCIWSGNKCTCLHPLCLCPYDPPTIHAQAFVPFAPSIVLKSCNLIPKPRTLVPQSCALTPLVPLHPCAQRGNIFPVMFQMVQGVWGQSRLLDPTTSQCKKIQTSLIKMFCWGVPTTCNYHPMYTQKMANGTGEILGQKIKPTTKVTNESAIKTCRTHAVHTLIWTGTCHKPKSSMQITNHPLARSRAVVSKFQNYVTCHLLYLSKFDRVM